MSMMSAKLVAKSPVFDQAADAARAAGFSDAISLHAAENPAPKWWISQIAGGFSKITGFLSCKPDCCTGHNMSWFDAAAPPTCCTGHNVSADRFWKPLVLQGF